VVVAAAKMARAAIRKKVMKRENILIEGFKKFRESAISKTVRVLVPNRTEKQDLSKKALACYTQDSSSKKKKEPNKRRRATGMKNESILQHDNPEKRGSMSRASGIRLGFILVKLSKS
jgi:hypothetical protein